MPMVDVLARQPALRNCRDTEWDDWTEQTTVESGCGDPCSGVRRSEGKPAGSLSFYTLAAIIMEIPVYMVSG
jgi:hypothetical protein